jgi:hypothetical protein
MQIKHIALASLALIASVQAQAVTRISGASASSIGYVEALSTNGSCPSNNVSVYVRGTALNALGNNFTVKCNSGNFGTTGESEVQFDVNGGSLNAILFSASVDTADTALAANGGFLPATTTGCTAATAAGGLTFLNFVNGVSGTAAQKLKLCSATAALTSGKSVGGFMDVEPAIFTAQNVIAGDYTSSVVPANFSQAFAVGVSNALYLALQADQGLAAGTAPANQPSISKAQLNAVMNSIDFNDAKANGAKFLAPSLAAAAPLYYCRRPNTSGTQMSAELYFLQNPTATGALRGASLVHEPSTGANLLTVAAGANEFVVLNSGTGDVKKCLNGGTAGSAPAGSYAVGILSAENNPVGTSDTYKLVKVQGASVSEGVAGASQTATAIKGQYDFVYESVIFNPTGNAVLTYINDQIKTGTGTPGVFLNVNSLTPESNFSRNGSSVNAFTSN